MGSHYCQKIPKDYVSKLFFSTYHEIYELYVDDCETKTEKDCMKLPYPISAVYFLCFFHFKSI